MAKSIPPTDVVVNGDGTVTVSTTATSKSGYCNVQVYGTNGTSVFLSDCSPSTIDMTELRPYAPLTAQLWQQGTGNGPWKPLAEKSEPFTP